MVKGSKMIGTSVYGSQLVPGLAQRTIFLSVIIPFNCSSILLLNVSIELYWTKHT